MKHRLLIVDDDAPVRNALKRSLRGEGYEIEVADGPNAGLKLLAERPFDVILSDHMMPEMSGIEFLGIVRDRFPDTVRIMLTGHADMQTAIDGINKGELYRFLTKPWDDLDLKVTLHLAVESLELQRENRRLLSLVRHQKRTIDTLERNHPGIGLVSRDSSGAILLDSTDA